MLKMLNCRDATQMLSSALDQSEDISTPLSLKLHLMMCSGCRRYANQTQLLRQVSRQFVRSAAMEPTKIDSSSDEHMNK